jgi:YggT family protein
MPSLVTIADYVLDAIIYLLLAVAILSWFPIDPRNKWLRLLHSVTDPILHPIRALVPPIGGFSLDILIAVVLLGILQRVLHQAVNS